MKKVLHKLDLLYYNNFKSYITLMYIIYIYICMYHVIKFFFYYKDAWIMKYKYLLKYKDSLYSCEESYYFKEY